MGDVGRLRQQEIYLGRLAGRQARVPVAPQALEDATRRALRPERWAYLAGGAGREATMDANRRALDRCRIVPRVLRNVEERDLSISLFGRRLPTPLLLAPIGVLELAHEDADLAVARAAARRQVPFIFSSQASRPMEATADAMGKAPRWFQLYWSRSDELVGSFVSRAERCGCEAIVLTLDTTMLGWRPRDLDHASLPFLQGRGIAQYTSDPVFRDQLRSVAPRSDAAITPHAITTALGQMRRYPGFLAKFSRAPRLAVQHFLATYSRPSLRWEDIPTLRSMTSLPILLKGILHRDDATRAVNDGVDGLIVSNHGGRQVDGAIGALEALPSIVDAVAGRVPVLFDSGVRGGADVFKALALGATAVCLGRPYAYGLAVAGEHGVDEVLANVLAELDLTMGLSGCASIAEISRSHVTIESN